MAPHADSPLSFHHRKQGEPEKKDGEDTREEEEEGEEFRQRLPAIPDLRFEYSYLRSIRRYIHLRNRDADRSFVGGGQVGDVEKVDWGKVVWTTFASQVLSPLLQGALWGVAGHFITPFMKRTFQRTKGRVDEVPSAPKEEGKISAWLRGAVQKLRLRPQTSESP